jgi:hypothetical protein
MAIKEKNQPASNQPSTSLDRGLTKDGFLVNSQIDARLDKFMADNPEMTEHFTTLVKEHPDRAIRSFMLKSMFKHEKTAERNALQLPQVREWVEQNPGLAQEVASKIKTTNPIMRAAAFIRGIGRAKANIDFSPPATKTGIGIPI